MSKSTTDSRRVLIRTFLEQLANRTSYEGTADAKPANTSELDNLLESIDSELTPLLRMDASNPIDLTVSIGGAIITNPESARNRSIPYVGTSIPNDFSSGTVVFPATSGGTVTVTPGNNGTLTLTNNNYIKCLVYLDSTGNLNVAFGTEGASEALATVPSPVEDTYAIGYITLFNNAGTISNITQSNIYQFDGLGASPSSSGGVESTFIGSGVIGEIIAYASDAVPKDHLYCDGSAVSRTTYSKLFEKVGVTWGAGDGSTTFNLPNLVDYFLRGDGTLAVGGTESDSTALPNSAFAGTTNLTGNHNHGGTYHQQSASAGTSVAYASTLNPSTTSSVPTDGAHQHTVAINSGGDAETRPQNKRVKFCIRYDNSVVTEEDQIFNATQVIYSLNGSSANIDYAHNTFERMDFNNKIKDDFNLVTTGASWAFTADKEGLYLVDARFNWQSTANFSANTLKIRQEGSTTREKTVLNSDYNASLPGVGCTIFHLQPGDTLHALLRQQDSGSSSRSVGTGGSTDITITRILDLSVVGLDLDISPSGSAEGSRDKNYFDDLDCDTIDNIVAYDDTNSVPVDGVGGSPSNVTVALNSSTPISGDNSYRITFSSSGSSVGEGASIDTNVTFDKQILDRGVIDLEFSYAAPSGLDETRLKWYYYRVGSNIMMPLIYTKPDGSRGSEVVGNAGETVNVRAKVNINNSDTAIRIVCHSELAVLTDTDIDIDRIFIGKIAVIESAISTDWETFTPVFHGLAQTPSAVEGRVRREADTMYGRVGFRYNLSSGGSNTGSLELEVPNNQVMDSSKLTNNLADVGYWNSINGTTISNGTHNPINVGSTFGRMRFQFGGTYDFLEDQDLGLGQYLEITFSMPIQDWDGSSNILNTTQQLFKSVFVDASSNNGQTVSGVQTIIYEDVYEDKLGAYDNTTGVFTAPSAGLYYIKGSIRINDAAYNGSRLILSTSVAGQTEDRSVVTGTSFPYVSVSGIYRMEKGDTAFIQVDENDSSTVSLRTDRVENNFYVAQILNFEVIGNAGTPHEYIRVDLPSSSSSSSFGRDVWGDCYSSSFDIEVSPGIWEVGYETNTYIQKASVGSSTTYYANVGIFDVTNSNRIQDSITFFARQFLNSGITEFITMPTSRKMYVICTQNTTYRLQLRHGTNNSFVQLINDGFTGAITDPDAGGYWYALRLV